MLIKLFGVLGFVACGVLLYILTSTTPKEAGAIGVLTVFLLSYIMSVVVLAFFIFFSHRVFSKIFYSDRTGRVSDEFTMKRSYYYGSILALGPVILVSLRSVGKVGPGELVLVFILLVLGCLYVSRQT